MKLIKKIGILLVAALAVAITCLAIANPDTFAETSAESKDESLRPRRYKTSLENFAAETEKIIPTLTTYGQNWKFVSRNVYENSASIKAEVPVLVFTDDLEIKAVRVQDEVIVDIYSSQRVGFNDWGENRRHVLQILQTLDERFSSEKAETRP